MTGGAPTKGKVVLVTGGTGGLGSVLVARFKREGWSVFATITPGTPPPGDPGTDGFPAYIPADVTDEPSVVRLFDEIVRRARRVDVVVNTVGGYVAGASVEETTLEAWDLMMRLNLRSAFVCTREALRRMKGSGFGRVINVSAMSALSPAPGRAAYGVSKSGVALLTEIAAREVKGTGITVNAVAPSIIDTPANRSSMPGEKFDAWVKPDAIAEMILYLCSEGGGAVNGTVLKAAGGL